MERAEQTVQRYFECFGARNEDDLAALFAPEAVFMPNGVPTIRGQADIRIFFAERVFAAAEVAFEQVWIDSVCEMPGASVIEARTLERIHAVDAPEHRKQFRETFTLQERDGRWLIVSYMGNGLPG
jgi:ketosteroid isomerase-like protein